MKFIIINGPNLNLLGKRQPEIYGATSFESYLDEIREAYSTIEITYYQSNVEGELINKIHSADAENFDGIILNAGGYSHSSVALADAVSSIDIPVVGVHISNIYAREEERHKELLAQYLVGGVFGLGLKGYEFAIQYLLHRNQTS
ncbi:3-dehydroquinate dehydratase [bacterium]|nr:3-dehydroquinate dehydratase [bacterium]